MDLEYMRAMHEITALKGSILTVKDELSRCTDEDERQALLWDMQDYERELQYAYNKLNYKKWRI